VVVEVHVEQIDVPRELLIARHVSFRDLPRDGQGCVL
jgi:hypothetical protein